MDNFKGNFTSIVNWIVCMTFPVLSVYGVSESTLTSLVAGLLGLISALVNSYYPNSFKFLNNNNNTNDDGFGDAP